MDQGRNGLAMITAFTRNTALAAAPATDASDAHPSSSSAWKLRRAGGGAVSLAAGAQV